ncbi:hypothetical protein [Streptosporangium vulgare]|uniref:hypothetical protein n=1 Tax=Streptosporangium vulgare TaxID=46190 RepID=UPI0031DA4EAE
MDEVGVQPVLFSSDLGRSLSSGEGPGDLQDADLAAGELHRLPVSLREVRLEADRPELLVAGS